MYFLNKQLNAVINYIHVNCILSIQREIYLLGQVDCYYSCTVYVTHSILFLSFPLSWYLTISWKDIRILCCWCFYYLPSIEQFVGAHGNQFKLYTLFDLACFICLVFHSIMSCTKSFHGIQLRSLFDLLIKGLKDCSGLGPFI